MLHGRAAKVTTANLPATRAVKTTHFTITGAAFTKLVRSRMLNDAPPGRHGR